MVWSHDRLRDCLALAAVAALLAGCAGGAPGGDGGPATDPGTSATAAPSSQTPCGVAPTPPKYEHVVWLVMENHGRDQVVGNPAAPYTNGLMDRCGSATNMHAETHPSLPNYIAMTSGGTQGVKDDGPPAEHPLDAPSIFSQLGAGRWRSLSQSMPGNCHREDSGHYVPRHNPPTYFTNIADQCAKQAVPLGDQPDLSAPFTFVVPDQRSNTHDTDIAYGDSWLAGFLPTVLDSPEYRSGLTVVVVTWDEDEDEGNPANPIPTIVIAPSTPAGTKDDTHYTHYSLLRTTEELLGLGLLGEAAHATSMRAGFHL